MKQRQNTYKKSKALACAALLFTSLNTIAQPVTLTIEDCRAKAVEQSELIKMGQARIEKADAEIQVAKSLRRPNINASAMGMYNEMELQTEKYLPNFNLDPASGELVPDLVIDPSTGKPVIGPDGNPLFNSYSYLPLDYSSRGGYTASVALEQAIYAGGKINSGNRMAKLGRTMADEAMNLDRSNTIYETDQAYYRYVSTLAKIDLANQYKSLLKQLVEIVNNAYETGMKSRNDLLKAKVQLNDAKLKVQQANTGGELTRMSLCRAIGLPFETELEIGDQSQVKQEVDLDHLQKDDVTNRSEYALLEKRVTMEQEKVNQVKGDYRPTIGFSVGYRYTSVDLEEQDNYQMEGINVLGSVKIPITTFGERKGKVASAQKEQELRQLELQRNKEFLALEMAQARLTMIDAYTRIELSEESVKQAEENLRVSKDNYEVGMETIVNLLEAQAEWQKAVSNKIDANTEYKIKESNYLRVTNRYKVN